MLNLVYGTAPSAEAAELHATGGVMTKTVDNVT